MSNTSFEWKKAQDLDHAWSNFDPYYPLPSDSPFYVKRKDSPLESMKRALLRDHIASQKYFFSGFMGCGKSTELNRLAVDRELNEKYLVVNFSIRDTCDQNNLNYVDVLVAIGAKIFEVHDAQGGKLDPAIYDELKTWTKHVEERIREKGIETSTEAEAGAETPRFLNFFWAKLTGKIKAEYSSRKIIRETLEPTLTELLSKLNLIAAGILRSTGKHVLVIVDDLDKPSVDDTKKLFKENLATLRQPNLYIIYTVPVWIFFSKEFPEIKHPIGYLLPNIKLHPQNSRTKKETMGFQMMEDFITQRMRSNLIAPKAMEHAIEMSGGVFRELARIMQIAIDAAIERENNVIQLLNVERAVNELRNDFRRILQEDDYVILKQIYARRTYEGVDRIASLLEGLLVLEYKNDQNWPDIHPVLVEIIQSWQEPKKTSAKKRLRPKSS